MATQRKQSAYQSLGNGVYRVTGVAHRSALTGLYVTKSDQTGSVPSRPKSSAPGERVKKSR
jgi:hypothetical protein